MRNFDGTTGTCSDPLLKITLFYVLVDATEARIKVACLLGG